MVAKKRLVLQSCLFLLSCSAALYGTRASSSAASCVATAQLLPPAARNALVVVAAGTCIALSLCVKVVTTGDACLIERFGKFHRKIGPGWHLIAWPLESVSFHATLREQVMDIPPQQCHTLDNAPLTADAVVYLRIFDIERAKYSVQDVNGALRNICLTQVREEVGKLTLDECFSSRERINKALVVDLNAVCSTWGVEVTRVEMQNIEPSRHIVDAMELQMAAERKKRAAILQSEGERVKLSNEAEGRASALLTDAEAQRKSILLKANAECERQRLVADGLRQSIDIVASAISSASGENKDAVDATLQLLMLMRYMETQAKFANGDGTKVFMFPSKDTVPLTYEGLRSMLN